MTADVRCAVVDAYSTGRFLPALLRQRGADVVQVQSTPQVPRHLRAVCDPDAERDAIIYDGAVDHLVRQLRALGVTHVVAGAESGVILADALAARLGTPGHGMRDPHARRNKALMAERVRRSGLDTARGITVSRPAEALPWLTAHDRWPVIVKPVDSAGGDNVRVCANAQRVLAAVEDVQSSRNMTGGRNRHSLVQEFLEGEEYFVNTVSWAGRHHVAEVWRYMKRRLPDGHVIYDYEEPLRPEDPLVARLGDYTVRVLDALEIRNGAAHTELMMTARGPVLIETGARLAGSVLPHVVSRCFGVSQLELLAEAVTAPAKFLSKAGRRYRVVGQLRYVSLINRQDGVVRAPDALEPIKSLPTYADMVFTVQPGQRIRRTMDSASSPGTVYLYGDPIKVERDYQRLRTIEQEAAYVC